MEPSGDASQKAYIEEVIKYLRSLPIVKITLAFEPDDTFSNRINEVITSLIGGKVVLDIEVNHHIIAGITIEYKGKFADYSFEGRTEEFLKKNLRNFISEEDSEQTKASTRVPKNSVEEHLSQ